MVENPSGEIRKQGITKSKEVAQANGEAVPQQADKFLYDTLTIPDLAAVEASFDRSRLLTEQGTDVAAMALDVANTIQAGDRSEKMLAHQLAAMHKVGMEMIGSVVPHSDDAAIHNRRLNAAVRCMTAFQQGLLALRKLKSGGHQRISVQYVNVTDGSQAVIGNVTPSQYRREPPLHVDEGEELSINVTIRRVVISYHNWISSIFGPSTIIATENRDGGASF